MTVDELERHLVTLVKDGETVQVQIKARRRNGKLFVGADAEVETIQGSEKYKPFTNTAQVMEAMSNGWVVRGSTMRNRKGSK